jgi:hypothetical protein
MVQLFLGTIWICGWRMNMLATQYQPRLSRITDAAQGGSAYQIAVYIHSHQIKLL